MKKLASILMLLGLASQAAAEVPDDSTWVLGDKTVTVDVEAVPTANDVTVTFTSGGDSSTPVTGTPGASSTGSDPTCEESPAGSANGDDFRCHNGKTQVKGEDGTWKNMRKKRGNPQPSGMQRIKAGDPAPKNGWLISLSNPTVYLTLGDIAPWSGWLQADEEVVSLP